MNYCGYKNSCPLGTRDDEKVQIAYPYRVKVFTALMFQK